MTRTPHQCFVMLTDGTWRALKTWATDMDAAAFRFDHVIHNQLGLDFVSWYQTPGHDAPEAFTIFSEGPPA